MYARIITTQAMPDLALDRDETIRLWNDHLAAIYDGAEGFQGAYVLGNPGEHTALTITLWENEEAADASGTFEQVLAHIREALALAPKIDGYEVLYEMRSSASDGG